MIEDKKVKKRGFGPRTLFFVALVSLVAGIGITASLEITSTTKAQDFWTESEETSVAASAPGSGPGSFTDLARTLSPAVVNISTTQVIKREGMGHLPEFRTPFDDFFGDEFKRFFEAPEREFKTQSLGSGFVINREGYLITNNHVIENATEIIVKFSDNRKEYSAEVVGKDKSLDLALLKIEADNDLPIVPLGDSDDLDIGQWVIAIGNPFGLGGTVTAGIVSQKGRVIGAGPYDNFIQTDASINPGNSGGPLFNLRGEVVGVNTAIIAGGQGLGFAIPVNMVKDVLLQLKDEGHVTRGWIGVMIQEITPEIAESFGLKELSGALISGVTPGDPAEEAGLKTGDIIIEFDGKTIDELKDLPRAVAATRPDKKAKLRVIRDGKKKTFFVKVGKKKEAGVEEEADKKEGTDETLGLSVQTLTKELAKRYGLDEDEIGSGGVLVLGAEADGLAATAGIRRGDIIVEVNRATVKDVDEYTEAVKLASKGDVVLLLLRRGSSFFYVAVKLPKDK